MNDFQLSPEQNAAQRRGGQNPPREGLVPIGYVARLYGVSDEAVRKWCLDGCPVAEKTSGPSGSQRRWFHVEQVRVWVSANRAHHGAPIDPPTRISPAAGMTTWASVHGGKRSGSGRKRGRPSTQHPRPETPLLDQPAEHTESMPMTDASSLSPLNVEKARHEKAKAELAEMKLAEQRRELVKRTDVEAAIVAASKNLAGLCVTMSQRLAAEIVSRAALPAGMFPVVEELVRVECDTLVDALLADPLGEGAEAESRQAA